ncbi:unnamed protein product [Adineta ricciae]|uniref:Uncharacterized protein n=1 Tax=Adineta ricciae TaxID=249248 RepID=A0A815SYH5_ADIRI|nr:unnamed protein product [Adineta ricciae]CAF1498084.1 unnamed protein product [Adineta ricciae]
MVSFALLASNHGRSKRDDFYLSDSNKNSNIQHMNKNIITSLNTSQLKEKTPINNFAEQIVNTAKDLHDSITSPFHFIDNIQKNCILMHRDFL